jgi:hypothetical protein
MSNICGTTSTALTASATAAVLLAFFMSVATALWAMWTMLGAGFDSGWLQAALMLMLWMAAARSAYLCLVQHHGRPAPVNAAMAT